MHPQLRGSIKALFPNRECFALVKKPLLGWAWGWAGSFAVARLRARLVYTTNVPA